MTAEPLPLQIPQVQGRHRNKVLAARRRTRAIELVTAGHTYQQVADQLGYANKGSVHHIVHRALANAERTSVAEHRELAYSRLEALLSSVWDQAKAGDLAAVQAALNVVQAEMRLLGLISNRPANPQAEWHCCQGPPMLVTRTDDCRWRGCLLHGRFPDDQAPNVEDPNH